MASKPPSVPPTVSSVKPGQDFYRHVNGAWQRTARIPTYAGSFGISEEIEEVVREDLLATIRSLDAKHPLSLLAKSVLNPHVQDNNVRDLRLFLRSFDCLRDAEEVGRMIGTLNRMQSRAPLTFSVNADTYKSSICRVHIYEPTVGLPSRSDYAANAGRGSTILHYAEVLKKTGALLEVEGLDAVIPIEKAILPTLSEGDSLRDPSESYLALKLAALESRWPAIPWRAMFLSWGMPTDLMREYTYIVTNETYIDQLARIFKTFEMDAWRVWLRASVVLTFLEYLPPPFDDLHYELFGRRLRGNVQKLPQHRLMLKVLQTFATQSLSRAFVEDHIKDRVKHEATTMVRRLKSATAARIRGLTWMSDSTKRVGVKKVAAMRFQVAFPAEWTNEMSGINVDPERMLKNIWALSTKDTARMIDSLGDGCGESDGTWEDGAFEVNAYYYPDKNQLTIPGGMLRPPFFDLSRSVAWNYGGIGSAIGHEITHGFDAEGKSYDQHGNFKDWWTKADDEAYTRITEGLVHMYDGEEYAGGKVNGRLTLSENIADIGGVAIALHALKDYCKEHRCSSAEQKTAYRDFFVSYAVSWRNKDRPRKARQSLFLDVHAPAPLRVNLVVRQFAEFYEAFDVGETDAGWIPVEKRIQLW